MTERLYVDLHILQSVPPSNLNRDDAGSPKQAMYGGARRARVSSQAWKKATRRYFDERLALPPNMLGTRTADIGPLLAQRLTARAGLDSDRATRLANALLGRLGIKAAKKNEAKTAYLLFFGISQLDAIIDLLGDRVTELASLPDDTLPKQIEQLPVSDQLTRGHPIDVALFGRMVADLPKLNVDAATQVAHAISTHAAEIEFDYYTATDDLKDPRESRGAGMVGTVEFTSATFYRYATVNIPQLRRNLGGDADAASAALNSFIEAFVLSMPTGHQNTLTAGTTPSLVSVMIRDDQPVNLVSAFEKPVYHSDGLVERSSVRLADEFLHARDGWGLVPRGVVSHYPPSLADAKAGDRLVEAFGQPVPFPQLVSTAVAAVRADLTAAAVR